MKTNASQRGATLVVALIFLVLMSLFAISAFNSSSSNLRIVGNSQAIQESLSTAQMAVEATISTRDFYKLPIEKSIEVDMNGDGTPEYTAAITPAPVCYQIAPFKVPEPPDPDKPVVDDIYVRCRAEAESGGIFSDLEAPETAIDPKKCYASEWNVRAEVIDAATQTRVSVNQGVAVIDLGAYSTYCTK